MKECSHLKLVGLFGIENFILKLRAPTQQPAMHFTAFLKGAITGRVLNKLELKAFH